MQTIPFYLFNNKKHKECLTKVNAILNLSKISILAINKKLNKSLNIKKKSTDKRSKKCKMKGYNSRRIWSLFNKKKKQRKIKVMRYKNLKNNQSNHPQINKKVIINQNYKNRYMKITM